jgi:hypothetical protein
MKKDRAETDDRIAITGNMTRHDAEALQLEIRRLAKRYGVEIKALKVERIDEIVSGKRGKLRPGPV